ncbi:MAG TPA: Gfo/Idh/MocA family oxidoreductase [Anaerolineales bacterium]|nr:Gfo/Idh/MocA family oxidoreductase [Anaerolineales bacterium]
MTLNPIIATLGRRLRLAVVGGGPGSFIGAMHRQAARLDDRYELVAGVLSSNPDKAEKAGLEIGLAPERTFTNVQQMLVSEAARPDGAEVIAIMTPNDSHYEYAVAALERGFDVICDKPMTNTLAEAERLHQKVQQSGLVFCLTHNYTGYPMVRQAKAMVMDGQLGTIRLVQVEYVQGGKAAGNDPDPAAGDLPWRYDPVRGGPSLVMGDIGTHAHNLLRFITGLEVSEVAAEVGAIVPGRQVHDYAGALLRLENGARGSFWVTQAAAGVENCLRIRVSGTLGTLEWMQEIPQTLTFKPLNGPSQIRTPNGPGTLPLAKRASRIVAGHPEGFPEGFANIYSDAAEAIAARRTGTPADPLALYFPTSLDGLLGVRFVHSVIASSQANGQWMKC